MLKVAERSFFLLISSEAELMPNGSARYHLFVAGDRINPQSARRTKERRAWLNVTRGTARFNAVERRPVRRSWLRIRRDSKHNDSVIDQAGKRITAGSPAKAREVLPKLARKHPGA